MSNISKHQVLKSGFLTIVSFDGSGPSGGDHLGQLSAKAGKDGAFYDEWINTNGIARAVFIGKLNDEQNTFIASIGAKSGVTTATDWDYEKRKATSTPSQMTAEQTPLVQPQYE